VAGDWSGFAALHVDFADRVTAVTGVDRVTALRTWTPAAGMAGVHFPDAPTGATLGAAYDRQFATPRPSDRVWFGCFGYEIEDHGGTVRVHFGRRDPHGALTDDRQGVRRAELTSLFAHAAAAYPQARRYRGGSWLYHLDRYRRLFPPSVVAALAPEPTEDGLRMMALWGQFVRGDRSPYRPRVDEFTHGYRSARSPRELLDAFPLVRLGWSRNRDTLS
jgi:hypothetical protein